MNEFSTTHEIRPLCYAQMKAHYPKILESIFEVVIPKGWVVSFIFEAGQYLPGQYTVDLLTSHIFGTKEFLSLIPKF